MTSQDPPAINGDAVDGIMRSAKVPVMFVFGAQWCEACRRQTADALEVARRMAGRAEVYIVDIDASRQAAGRFNIHSIPTAIVFDGAVERARFIGLQSSRTLIAALAQRTRAHPLPRPVSRSA